MQQFSEEKLHFVQHDSFIITLLENNFAFCNICVVPRRGQFIEPSYLRVVQGRDKSAPTRNYFQALV